MNPKPKSRSYVIRFGLLAAAVVAAYWWIAYPNSPSSPPAEATHIEWLDNFQTAKNRALGEGKLLLADFSADWCPPCRQLESEVFSTKTVVAAATGYVPLRVDMTAPKQRSWQIALATKYKIGPIPDVVIINPRSGALISRSIGFIAANEMAAFLKKHDE